MSAGNKGPVWVASTVALLGALAGILQYGVPYFQWLMNHPDPQVAELQTSFNAGIADLENSVTSKPSDTLELRVKAAEAYRRAAAGPPNRTLDWKCQVVDMIYSASDPDIAQATPLDAYTDYDNSALTKCADKVFDLALLDWDAFLRLKAQSDGALARQRLIKYVVAKGTTSNVVGWTYIGQADSNLAYTIKYIKEPTANMGQTVTISSILSDEQGVPLHDLPPSPTNLDQGGIAGFLPEGSRATILDIRKVEERRKGAQSAYLVFAKAKVVAVEPLSAIATNRGDARLRLARRVRYTVALASPPPRCPAYAQHNSLHSNTQLWVYVGEKPAAGDSGDAFVGGTSRVNTGCIPRDGQVVRATQDLKVLKGSDPHWPGVIPQGGVVAAGTDIRVVGDVSGYPFDATLDPAFCNRDPAPQRTLAPVPDGHKKLYCVYVPFTPN
jgi:hypothetical protein